jgi:hypothetical protein
MDPANPTERFLREPGDPGSIRIELWAADFLRPETFNAVIFGTGSVEVQSIEYQVEHRFRLGIPAAELEGLIAAIAAADPLSCPPQHDRGDQETGKNRHPPPTRVVLVNATGGRREFSFQDDPPEAFDRCRRAIVEVADPFRRGIEPLWSRGPYIGDHPFPESE